MAFWDLGIHPENLPMRKLALPALLLLALSVPAHATLVHFSVVVDATKAQSQAMPGATGSGTGTITLDTATGEVSYDVSWSGTQGTAFFSHFHGAAAPGVFAPARYFISNGPQQAALGSITLSDPVPVNGAAYTVAQQMQDLIDGLWYVNVHTTHSTQGEIRGQILVPEPRLAALLGLLAVARFAMARPRA